MAACLSPPGSSSRPPHPLSLPPTYQDHTLPPAHLVLLRLLRIERSSGNSCTEPALSDSTEWVFGYLLWDSVMVKC